MLPLIPIIGAVVAGGAIGALATKYFSDSDKKSDSDSKDREIAKMRLREQKLNEKFGAFHQKLGDTQEYFDFILGVMAFGVAIARVDKQGIDEDERQALEEFLLGAAAKNLPRYTKDAMRKIYEDEKMNFESALGFLYKIDQKGRKLIEETLYVVAYSNQTLTQAQREFIENYRIEESKIPYPKESSEAINKPWDI